MTAFASWRQVGSVALGLVVMLGGLVGLGCVVWGRRSLGDLGWTSTRWPRDLLVGLGLTAVLVAHDASVNGATAGAAGLSDFAHEVTGLTPSQRLFFTVMGARNAFYEETLFRGDLQRALERRGGRVLAIVGSSVAFALYHRTLSPVPLAMKLVFGLLFALAADRTRSLVAPGLAHWLSWAILANA